MDIVPCVNVHDCVQAALAHALMHRGTRFVNANVRMICGEIVVTYFHSDWFNSDSSVYCAHTDGKGEWL